MSDVRAFPSEINIRAEVFRCVKKYTGYSKPIDGSQRLYHDLGLTGDDAWEFFAELSALFNIREAQFDICQYFPAETDSILVDITAIFCSKTTDKWLPMTIDDVIAMLEQATNAER